MNFTVPIKNPTIKDQSTISSQIGGNIPITLSKTIIPTTSYSLFQYNMLAQIVSQGCSACGK
jgi:hypothetical protein